LPFDAAKSDQLMLSEPTLRIAEVLVEKARARVRTTYEQLAQAVDWSHPTGRGLGKHLYEVMHYCKAHSLPPLTVIVVRKGTRTPSPDALPHIIAALGAIDIDVKQAEVFAFDWASVADFALPQAHLSSESAIWLTSFWGFDPDRWGCLGFSSKAKRDYFVKRTKPGVIVTIYVTKTKGLEAQRGKIVGFLEVSHISGHIREFLAGDEWAVKESDPDYRGKWNHALKVTRAWRIVKEEERLVDELLPESYGGSNPQFIGSQGIPVKPHEADNLLRLTVFEVPVYGQTDRISSTLETFAEALRPSRAVYPASEPYWVSETDGPKHLYILQLTGNLSHYLGREDAAVEEKMIVKVGFSKSPLTRCDQIQAAYPSGSFKWAVLYPKEIPLAPPYPNAKVAIAGEDAMKARLQHDGGECLGREFYLADEGLVIRIWSAGRFAADEELKRAR
jgi:hypothetical protein